MMLWRDRKHPTFCPFLALLWWLAVTRIRRCYTFPWKETLDGI